MNPAVSLRIVLILGSVALMGGRCFAQRPAAMESRRQSALALEQQDQNAAAESLWREILRSEPRSAEAYAHLGLLEARQGRYKAAISLYRKALVLDPSMPGLRLNLGLSLFKDGELKDAVQEFQPLLKEDPPASPEARRLTVLIGMADYGQGKFAEAVPYLRQATEFDPRNLSLRLILAHSCLGSKQYPCVIEMYHEILSLNAESAEGDMLAGEALDQMQDYAGATAQFQAAVKADPKEPNVHFGLGYLLWSQNEYEEAAKEFQAELDNDPRNTLAMAYLADSDKQMNRPEAARPLLEDAIRIDPGMEMPHLDLGILDAGAGRHNEALRELLIAARLRPYDINVHWQLARLYKVMGKSREANVEFEKAVNLHKTANATVYDQLNDEPNRTRDEGKSTEKSQGALSSR